MELKKYQKEVLEDLRSYLIHLNECRSPRQAFNRHWMDKGINPNDLSTDYMHPYDDTIKGIPNVTIKVPTAGGKTFIACNALKPLFDRFPENSPRAVAWFVPSDPILTQTLRNLQNPQHPYRQCLNALFNNRVRIVGKEDALMGHGISPIDIREHLTIFVLSVQSFAAKNKEGRRSYRENGNLAEYTKLYDLTTHRVEGADETSLLQVISYLSPVVIVDESHNFEANLRTELLVNLNPSFILNLTATPKKKSNIISFVDAKKLKDENMVKLPVIVYNHRSVQDVIVNAIALRNKLEFRAAQKEKDGGPYIRPIVLFQAQPNIGEDNATYDKLKDELIHYDIPKEQIKIKTADKNELNGIDLLSKDCPVRYIITIDALKEGWDCPFAYILASVANRTSRISVEQILGRILRLPYTTKNSDELLNLAYVFTSSRDFNTTLDDIVKGLNNAGFSRKDFRKREVEPIWSESENFDSGTVFSSFEVKDETSPLMDFHKVTSIGIRPEDTHQLHQDNSAIESIESYAMEQSSQYNEDLNKSSDTSNDDIPIDLQDHTSMSHIKDIYIDIARGIKIPTFAMKVATTSIFEEKDEFIPLDKASLEEDFNLSNQNKTINFTLTRVEASKIDLGSTSKSGETEVQRKELSANELSRLRENFANMPLENKRNNAARGIAHYLKFNSIPSPAIEKYISDALEQTDAETIEDILVRTPLYADIFKDKISLLLKEYRKQRFEKLMDLGTIQCNLNYSFPAQSNINRECLGLYKGLYLKEGDMNSFEENIIRTVSNLDNVLFWHRNKERKELCINGYINHYPDFIVVTKKKSIILIETKGDDRDNSDSSEKIELGKSWEHKAGSAFHYYMVFNTAQMKGALTIAELIERLSLL